MKMAFSYMFLLLLLICESHSSYRTFSLTSLCQIRKPVGYAIDMSKQPPTIELHDSPSMSSVLIEQVWNNSLLQQFRHCEFKVKTRSKWLNGTNINNGLIVSIRELQLRRNLVGECVDYIIFEINDINPTSHRICGTVLGEDMHDIKNYYEIPDGFIKILVYIDKIDNHNYWGPYQYQTKIKLTITAFDECNGGYQLACTAFKCIHESLYDDSIVNCIPPYCADEPSLYKKCRTKTTYHTENTHIIAVSSAFVLVIIGIVIGWYCLKILVKYDRYGLRQRNVRERVATSPSVVYETVYVPSATVETLVERQSNTDEPPSYDSLYS